MNILQKFLRVVDGHEKTDFWLYQLFWIGPFFNPSDLKKMGQKRTGAKMSKVSKITLFMLVYLTNEFLKYVLYLQTFLPGLLPHCNLTYITSEKNYLTSSISFDMSYLKITFQTQFSGTSNTLICMEYGPFSMMIFTDRLSNRSLLYI